MLPIGINQQVKHCLNFSICPYTSLDRRDMKPLFFCRKCIVKAICNSRCDHIRKVLHVLAIVQISAIMTLCLSWAIGFGIMLGNNEAKVPAALTFAGLVIVSFLLLFLINLITASIYARFGRPDNHISKWC